MLFLEIINVHSYPFYILYSEDEFTFVLFGEQIIVIGGPDSLKVHPSCSSRGSKTYPHMFAYAFI